MHCRLRSAELTKRRSLSSDDPAVRESNSPTALCDKLFSVIRHGRNEPVPGDEMEDREPIASLPRTIDDAIARAAAFHVGDPNWPKLQDLKVFGDRSLRWQDTVP